MPEPLSVIALLLFGFIAGWVVRTAVAGGGSSTGGDPAPARPRDVVAEENRAAAAAAPEPQQQPEPVPVAAAEPPVPAAPAPAPAAQAPVASAPRSPEVDRAVQATLTAYDDVLDDWLDDRGQVGPSGRASLEAFDGALAQLERQDGADDVLASLRIAGDLIHERREQPMDAATDAALRGLEQRFRA